MQIGRSVVFFLILVAGAAMFIWLSSFSLPEVAASHFGASGTANGFMPRAFYVRFMLVFVVALPLALVFLTNLTLSSPKARINLPHRAYWLAPNRRAETIQFLCEHTVRFGALLVIFLCYVHWLVVRANAVAPPSLPSGWFIGGLVVFLIAAAIWAAILIDRFQNVRH